MSELALELIAKEKQERTGTLNISFCGLTEIPAEVAEMTWLHTLIVSNLTFIKINGKWVENLNRGEQNSIDNLLGLVQLPNLRRINCAGTQVADLMSLAKLQNLLQLGCSFTLVTDLTPLADLQNL